MKKHYLLQFFSIPDPEGDKNVTERHIAANFRNMAAVIQSCLEDGTVKEGSEATTALRKLLESRDAALRAIRQEES